MKQRKQLLFCPGPVNVAKNVLQAAVAHEIGHREPEFSTLFLHLQKNILTLFEIKNKTAYFPVILTGSGSAANEAVLSSLPPQHILVLSNGAFGERLYDIAKIHHKHVGLINFGWAKPMDASSVEHYLKTKRVDVVVMVHHETSTGMLNPIAAIGKLTKQYKKLFIVDAVSSAGAEKIDMESWNIGFLTTSSSKAIASLPGLSIVVGRVTEFEKLKDVPRHIAYLHLYSFYTFAKTLSQTPNTPAVQNFFALDQAIENIFSNGTGRFRALMQKKAERIRSGMKKLGLSFLIDENHMSSTLTTVRIPSSLSIKKIQAGLRKHNIIVYNGKGPLTDSVFQVATMGELSLSDIDTFLKALKTTLSLKTA